MGVMRTVPHHSIHIHLPAKGGGLTSPHRKTFTRYAQTHTHTRHRAHTTHTHHAYTIHANRYTCYAHTTCTYTYTHHITPTPYTYHIDTHHVHTTHTTYTAHTHTHLGELHWDSSEAPQSEPLLRTRPGDNPGVTSQSKVRLALPEST